MKRAKTVLKLGMLSLACLGMILPPPVLQGAVTHEARGQQVAGPTSTGPAEPASGVVDVALRPGGVLLGQVIDAGGVASAGTPVWLRQAGRDVAATATDRAGHFLLGGLRGGTYEIVAGNALATLQLWAPNTAPPSAQPGALLISGTPPVRGQQGPLAYWLGSPLVLAGLVAAAVAVPVAIHNHRISRVASP